MKPGIVETKMAPIKFIGSVYKKSRSFTIPKRVREELGIDNGDSVLLSVATSSGEELFRGRKMLKSGPEIYGKDIAHALTPGAPIVVEVSEPQFSESKAEAESFKTQERELGFQVNPEIRRVVEVYAMQVAKETLRGEKYNFTDFDDTSASESYDYTCQGGGNTYYVEVKGTQGPLIRR